jgi:hypothetical protein
MLEMGAVVVHFKVHLDVKSFSVIIGCIYTAVFKFVAVRKTDSNYPWDQV